MHEVPIMTYYRLTSIDTGCRYFGCFIVVSLFSCTMITTVNISMVTHFCPLHIPERLHRLAVPDRVLITLISSIMHISNRSYQITIESYLLS